MSFIAAAVVGAVGSVAGGVIGAVGANNAANAQVSSANYAANLQAQTAQNSLDFAKQQWATQQANAAPWLTAGTSAINELGKDVMPGGSLAQPWTQQFVAPTAATEQNDPGYAFRLQQGEQALDRGAAARGNLLTGGTAQAEQQYGQNYASNEYGNVYNRALGEYQQNYNIFQQNQANQYNRLAGVAGAGQQAVSTLGQEGAQAAGNVTNINANYANQAGQDYIGAGNARASGYMGEANALGGALGGLGGLFSQYALLQALTSGGGMRQAKNPFYQ